MIVLEFSVSMCQAVKLFCLSIRTFNLITVLMDSKYLQFEFVQFKSIDT